MPPKKNSLAKEGFKKAKKLSVNTAKKKLDAVFSQYIRARDKGRCFTCSKEDDPKRMQNGHFVSRAHNATRYDERNCNCQCVGCNVFKYGNMVVYAMNMSRKYGPEIIEELERKSREVKQWTVAELADLAAEYKEKLKQYVS